MDDFIFTTKKDSVTQQSSVEYYTVSGQEDFFDDDQIPRANSDCNKVYAKKTIRDNGTVRYSIKLSLNNKLYDPTMQHETKRTKSFLDSTVRDENRFKNVSPSVFNLYLTFLKTKNTAWLHNAQREDE